LPIPAQERRRQLAAALAKNPLLLDDQLATLLKVSIHTVRSDRRKAGIPEVRKRGDGLSDVLYARARTLSQQEIVGELLEVDLDARDCRYSTPPLRWASRSPGSYAATGSSRRPTP